ncbi:hypothetical protein [Arthrobacter sp. 35W]|uniref:hypothetical protein n=1 Tax=Arthrobacter sp. 35W TaxID=1132441 RepID=UPI0004155ED3|nr:hypothetical protein [Arthrobacter sp. 35W]
MAANPSETFQFTREDLQSAIASELDVPSTDYRIEHCYEDMVSEWAARTCDPESTCARYLCDGPVGRQLDLIAARLWARGRVLL